MKAFETFDPNDRVPYWFDATDRAADDGRTVTGYDLAIDESPDGALEIVDDSLSGAVVSFYPQGGTLYETYTLRCRYFYDNGDHFDDSRTLTIAEH